jgi:hypothetical protein
LNDSWTCAFWWSFFHLAANDMPGGIRDSRRNAGTLLAICDWPASILAAMTSARTETSERCSLEVCKAWSVWVDRCG